MRRFVTIAVAGLLALGGLAVAGEVAEAHECKTDRAARTCRPSAVYPNWRDNVVPLFDLEDRDDEQQKRDAQRWRDEHGCDTQYCVWADPSASVDDEDGPLTLHAGTAGEHSLAEAAHSDEGHDTTEFGNHDTHGGAIYVDVCLGSDEGTSFEDQAGACDDLSDTQVGITVVDHLTCPMGCADEYHVVRPFDPAYTQRQVDNTPADVQAITADPQRYVCGYEEQGSACY